MDWIKRLNSAMNYIEENITDSMDMENISKLLVVLRIIFKECLYI